MAAWCFPSPQHAAFDPQLHGANGNPHELCGFPRSQCIFPGRQTCSHPRGHSCDTKLALSCFYTDDPAAATADVWNCDSVLNFASVSHLIARLVGSCAVARQRRQVPARSWASVCPSWTMFGSKLIPRDNEDTGDQGGCRGAGQRRAARSRVQMRSTVGTSAATRVPPGRDSPGFYDIGYNHGPPPVAESSRFPRGFSCPARVACGSARPRVAPSKSHMTGVMHPHSRTLSLAQRPRRCSPAAIRRTPCRFPYPAGQWPR